MCTSNCLYCHPSMDIITFSFNHEKEIVCRISFSFLSVISPNFRSPSVQCQLSDFEVFYFCEMINDISIHFRLPNQLNLGDFLIRFCLSSSSRIPAFFPGIANNVHMPSSMWQYVIYHCLFSKNVQPMKLQSRCTVYHQSLIAIYYFVCRGVKVSI